MSLFRKSKKEKSAASRRRRHSGRQSVGRRLMEKNSLAAGALFLLFNAAAILVCFVGLSPVGQHPAVGQQLLQGSVDHTRVEPQALCDLVPSQRPLTADRQPHHRSHPRVRFT